MIHQARVKKLAVFMMVVVSSASQFATASSSDSATLTVGVATARCAGAGGDQVQSGFNSVLSIGSYSPTGLTGGKTVAAVVDTFEALCFSSSFSALNVSGFSSDPGASWLISITCNGVENTSGTFSYSGGEASWIFSTLFGFTGKSGSNVSCTIVHD